MTGPGCNATVELEADMEDGFPQIQSWRDTSHRSRLYVSRQFRVSTTTKAATMSDSSVTDTWAVPNRASYQDARGSESRTTGLPPGAFTVCMRDQAMGVCMPRPMALENASFAAKRVARKRMPRRGSRL